MPLKAESMIRVSGMPEYGLTDTGTRAFGIAALLRFRDFMLKKEIKHTVKKIHKISIDKYSVNILVVLLLSLFLSALGIVLSDVADLMNILRYIKAPMLFVLNFIPLVLLILALYHLTSRHWAAFGLGGGLYLVLHIINRFKIQLREEPLTFIDLFLGMEAANVVRFSGLPFSPLIIVSLLAWLLTTILLFAFFKSRKLRWPARIAGIIAPVALFVFFFIRIYGNTSLYNRFEVTGSIYSLVDQYRSRGFAYSFLYRAKTFKSIKPENYSKEEAQKILEVFGNPPYRVNEGKTPHIIAVMGEAFYDVDRIPGVKFNEGLNPLENFHRIAAEAYTGRILTEVFGGGTANTEFSFLTGHSIAVMPEMTSPYSYYLRRDTFSLARVLEKAGYASLAFHPGESWFYNRVNVYEYFGFDEVYFKKDMDLDKVEFNHGYVSDHDTVEFSLEKFREHLAREPGKPFFEFIVNIDNHGPYSKQDLGYPEILKKDGSMDEATYNILNNYLNGLMRCDKALGSFVDSLREFDEPVVFIYFSDHLPSLGEGDRGYKALGFEISLNSGLEAYLNHYGVPYFIWCNEAAKKLLDQNKIAPKKGQAPQISVNYLATELLEYVGLNGGGYFNFLSEQKKNWPVITGRFHKEGGEFTEDLTDEYKQFMDTYKNLQYYMIMDSGEMLGK
ncbi:MAG: LTA synthase family protein [Bacillota bacterium]